MAIIQRTRVVWNGFQGAPGYTNMFGSVSSLDNHDPNIHADQVASFFEDLASYIPGPVSLTLDGEVAYFEDSTGELLEYGSLTRERVIVASSSIVGRQGVYAGPAGAAVDWTTTGVRANRRVRGRTFLVPLRAAGFQDDGTLSVGMLGTVRAAAQDYANTPDSRAVVWARPRPAVAPGTPDAVPALPGVSFPITGAAVRDQVAVLRSRRD